MRKKIDNFFFNLFLLSVLFFKIPNFYILPFLKISFLTSQALSRIILLFIFFKIYFFKRKIFDELKNKTIFWLMVFFFVIQSISIIPAINIPNFWARYKDIIIGLASFFVFYFYKKEYKKIINVFLSSVFINAIYQFLLIYSGNIKELLSTIVYQKHFDLVLAKLESQGRLYIDSYDEILIPFLFLENNSNWLIKLFLLILIFFFSYSSNIRSRVLMVFISFFLSLFFIKKIKFEKIFAVFFAFLIIGFLASQFSFYFFKESFIDRIFFPEESTDIKPIDFRKNQFFKSLDIGKISLLGAGLGNYYDNLNTNEKIGKSLLSWFNLLNQGSKEYVHNIFGLIISESGYLSFFVFLLILLFFIKNDFKILFNNDYKKAIIISFWSLFSYGLFNPIIPGSYQFLFWGLRGLLL
jgi:hypothetical protein